MVKSKKQRAATVSTVRNMINSQMLATRERKQNTTATSGTCSDSGVVLALSQNLATGNNISDREGWQVTAEWCELRFQSTMNGATNNRVRLILFVDKLNLGSTPAVTDVLTAASVTATLGYYAEVSKRFKILVDKTFTFTTGTVSQAQNFVFKHKFRSMPISYTGTTGVNGKNGIFVLIIDDVAASHNTYALNWALRFLDG